MIRRIRLQEEASENGSLGWSGMVVGMKLILIQRFILALASQKIIAYFPRLRNRQQPTDFYCHVQYLVKLLYHPVKF